MITRQEYIDNIRIWKKTHNIGKLVPSGYQNMKKEELKQITQDLGISMAKPKTLVKKDRTTINKIRDEKLKELRKGKGAGRPKMTDKRITRDDINRMREAEMERVKDMKKTIKIKKKKKD